MGVHTNNSGTNGAPKTTVCFETSDALAGSSEVLITAVKLVGRLNLQVLHKDITFVPGLVLDGSQHINVKIPSQDPVNCTAWRYCCLLPFEQQTPVCKATYHWRSTGLCDQLIIRFTLAD